MTASTSRRPSGVLRRAYIPPKHVAVLLLFLHGAGATPTPTKRNLGTSEPAPSNNTNAILQTWIPVALVTLLVMGLFVLTWTKRGRTWIASFRNRQGGETAAAPASTARVVRPRRRRRPSQVSTKSLPAYMEEPGEEELVLVRRTAAAESNSSDEHTNAETLTLSSSQAPSYTDVGHDLGPATLPPAHLRSLSIGESIGPQSTDTAHLGSDESNTSLMRAERRASVRSMASVRSAAPSYREVVGAEEAARASQELERQREAGPTEEEQQATVTQRTGERRRSGFFGLFGGHSRQSSANAVETGTSPSGGAQAQGRNSIARPSGDGERWFSLAPLSRQSTSHSSLLTPSLPSSSFTPAATSSTTDARRPSSPSSSSARPTSFVNPNASRTHLTSPSLTSLSSAIISPPLTHTATRVSFDYPRSGPTPQQVKFISSRETLERFGVPFGVEAEAAAAAARSAAAVPPPAFEEAEGEGATRPSTDTGRSEGRVVGMSAERGEFGEAAGGTDVDATIRAPGRPTPTVDTASSTAAPRRMSLTPPEPELGTPHATSPPTADLTGVAVGGEHITPTRPKVPLSIPLPPASQVGEGEGEESVPGFTIIPATPLNSVPPTPAGEGPAVQARVLGAVAETA